MENPEKPKQSSYAPSLAIGPYIALRARNKRYAPTTNANVEPYGTYAKRIVPTQRYIGPEKLPMVPNLTKMRDQS